MANTYSTTIKKGQYTKKVSNSEYQIYHFTTDTNQVTLDEPLSSITTGASNIPAGTTLQNALQAIKEKADSGGNAATTLDSHISNKNNPHGVTKAQVELGEVVNKGMDSKPVSGSTNYVQSGGVYSAIADAKALTATAQKKADSAYDLANGRSTALVFTSVENLISGKRTYGSITSTVTLDDFKIGDSVFITTSKVSDFWISSISRPLIDKNPSTAGEITAAKDGGSVIVSWADKYVTLVAVETKTDLAPYITSNEVEATYVKKDDAVGITGDVTGFGSFNAGISVSLNNSGITAGTYSALTVDSKGRATKGAQMVIFATSLNDSNLSNLAVGGIAVIEN